MAAANHFDTVLVGEDGEVGLWFKEKYIAAFIVFAHALDGTTGHHNTAFAVGTVEEFVADTVEHQFGIFEGGELATVVEHDDNFGLALRGEACDVMDGDELLLGGEHTYASIGHQTVLPTLVDSELSVLEVLVFTVFEAGEIVSVAAEKALFVVLDEASFKTTVDISAGDVALTADAFPPAAMAMVVAPVGHFGGVALLGIDDVDTILDAHAIVGFFDKATVFSIKLPMSVAIAAVILASSDQTALFVESFMVATHAGFGVDIAHTYRSVGVIVGESACFLSVEEVALIDFCAILVEAYPVALASALTVDLVLSGGLKRGKKQHGGEKQNCLFHCEVVLCVIVSLFVGTIYLAE